MQIENFQSCSVTLDVELSRANTIQSVVVERNIIDNFSRFYRRGLANTYKNTSVYPRIIWKCL